MNDNENNLRIAETICERFAWDGQIFREGDFVALLDGNVIAVTTNPNEAIARLRARDPDPSRGMVVEVAHPGVDVIR